MPGKRKLKDQNVNALPSTTAAATLADLGAASAFAEMGLFDEALDLMRTAPERRKIVVLSTEPDFESSLVSHALGLAGRLGSELVAVIVGPGNRSRAAAGGEQETRFSHSAASALREFERQATAERIPFQPLLRFGKPSEIVERLCVELRRVEFVLTSKKHKERHAFAVGMAVFAVGA